MTALNENGLQHLRNGSCIVAQCQTDEEESPDEVTPEALDQINEGSDYDGDGNKHLLLFNSNNVYLCMCTHLYFKSSVK